MSAPGPSRIPEVAFPSALVPRPPLRSPILLSQPCRANYSDYTKLTQRNWAATPWPLAMLPNKEVRVPRQRVAQAAVPRDITAEFTEAASSKLIALSPWTIN